VVFPCLAPASFHVFPSRLFFHYLSFEEHWVTVFGRIFGLNDRNNRRIEKQRNEGLIIWTLRYLHFMFIVRCGRVRTRKMRLDGHVACMGKI
jgi:hypothetical protein